MLSHPLHLGAGALDGVTLRLDGYALLELYPRIKAFIRQQGGATVHALVKLNAAASSPKYKILALTRDASSEKAAALANLPGVSLLQGTLAKPETLFNEPIHGVFLLGPSPEGNLILDEEKEARVLVDLAVKRGVQHVVYSSADYSGTDENALPTYEGKRAIERYLQSHQSLPAYTIIRPTGFMENYYWPTLLQNVSSKLNPNHKSKLIAVNDIGYAAIDLAGDALTPRQIVAAFKDVTGIDLDAMTPQDFPPDFKKAYDFWNQHEFVADPAACRELLPDLLDLRKWLELSAFKK
ncbi:NAD(P)-binding protein [Hymenopellis radicata]|nr:NAD(P)-binding protein [Hymenopellis radicata]